MSEDYPFKRMAEEARKHPGYQGGVKVFNGADDDFEACKSGHIHYATRRPAGDGVWDYTGPKVNAQVCDVLNSLRGSEEE